ncbi:MAG: gliding motility-associated C-terminal domain-containing protein [Cytophagales bacterium]|nr:gliding motility-associated C-terminal domain-containing protein [Cytophagales bacterium]
MANPDTVAGPAFQTVDSIYFSSPGTYTIELWVTTSCCGRVRDTTTVTVIANTFNVDLAASNDSICLGDSITFIASPPGYISYEFFINGVSVQNSPDSIFTTTGLLTGDSVVVSAFVGNCFTNPSAILAPVVVPIPTALLTNSEPDSTICQGDSIIFTASPATYAFYDFYVDTTLVQSGSGNVFTTDTLTNGDSITVIVPNLLLCLGPSSNSITITVNPVPAVTLSSSDSNSTICVGDSVTFTVNPSGINNYEFYVGGTFVQSGLSNTYTTTNLTDGDSIVVAAISSFGCAGVTNTLFFAVNPPQPVILTSTADTICFGDSIIFTASPGGYDSYEFFSGATSLQDSSNNTYSATNLQPGDTITVVATHLGCPSVPGNAVSIAVLSGPAIALSSSDTTICVGDSVLFTASPAGFVNYEFFIGASSVQSDTMNTFTITTLTDGDSIVVIASDIYCPGPLSNTIVFTVNPLPNVTLSSDMGTTICDGDTVTITASAAGSNTYEFFINAILQNSTDSTYTTDSLSDGDIITVIATSSADCIGPVSNSLIFTVNPIPIAALISNKDTICSGESITFTANPSGCGTYDFYDGATLVQSSADSVFTTINLDTTNSIVAIVTCLGCPSPPSSAIVTTVIPFPNVTGNDTSTTCDSIGTITLTGSPLGGVWSGLGIIDTLAGIFSPVLTGAGNHLVTYTFSNANCSDTDTLVVTVNALPVNAGIDTSVCEKGDSIVLAGFSPPGGVWLGDGITDSTLGIFVPGATVAGLHSITYTLSDGKCTFSDTTVVTVNALPVVTLTTLNNTICEGDNITFTATLSVYDDYVFFVNADSVQDSVSNTYSTTEIKNGDAITVIATNLGCTGELSNELTVTIREDCRKELFIPSAFSPNEDEKNDTLYIRGIGIDNVITFVVYNRWGEKIFEKNDFEANLPEHGWDGTLHGTELNLGVFVYYVEVAYFDGTKESKNGDVTLIR